MKVEEINLSLRGRRVVVKVVFRGVGLSIALLGLRQGFSECR